MANEARQERVPAGWRITLGGESTSLHRDNPETLDLNPRSIVTVGVLAAVSFNNNVFELHANDRALEEVAQSQGVSVDDLLKKMSEYIRGLDAIVRMA